MRPHPRRARTNATSPEAWGTDQRSGFVGNQRDLCWQFEWAGTQLINTRILTYPDMLDTPNRQLGTIVLPPDPVSIPYAMPEPYPIDEVWPRIMELNTEQPGSNNAMPRYLERSTVGQNPAEISRSLETSTINMNAPTS
jgi:hypothetical protein